MSTLSQKRTKRLLVLGTVHGVQEQGNALSNEFKQVLLGLVADYNIKAILEEWTYEPRVSVAATLASERLKWKNIGTPNEEIFETWCMPLNYHPAKHKEGYLYVSEYGPLEKQNARETFMLSRIKKEMIDTDVGLVLVGLAHLHSMTDKLEVSGFDVTACYWLGSKSTH